MGESYMVEDLDTLGALWTADAVINETALDKDALGAAKLHAKWLQIFHRHKIRAKALENNYKKLRLVKWRYYAGKMDQSELKERGWEQFQYTLKSDIDVYMEGDNDLIDLGTKKFYHEELADFCKSVLIEIKGRVWAIRAAIDYQKLMMGG